MSNSDINNKTQIIKAPALRPKDKVAVIAPSSRPAKPSDLIKAQKIIEAMGFSAVLGKHVLATHGYMAGTDEQRLADLHWALTDDSVKAVWAITGGYGALRLLDKLPYAQFKSSPKIFLGADDANLLVLSLHKKTGVVTCHAPNLDRIDSAAATGRLQKFLQSEDALAKPRTIKTADEFFGPFTYAPVAKSDATSAINKGTIMPCNLTALVSLFGTDYQPELAGSLLLLEDRSERNDILDRWLTTLYISGKLAKVAAVGFGTFEKCDTRGANNMLSFEELATDRLVAMGLPSCFGFPFGQSSASEAVACGLSGGLDVSAGILTFDETAFS